MTLFAFAHRKWYRYEVPGDEGDGVREPGRLGSRPGSSSSRRRRRGFFRFFVDFFARARGNAPAPAAYATAHPRHVALCVFEGNFVGVVFARSLHYQFYAWYFFSLALLFAIRIRPVPGALASVAADGASTSSRRSSTRGTPPATPRSSGVLLAAHAVVLLGLWRAADEGEGEGGGAAGGEKHARGGRNKSE